jgi:hypothetical protein
MAGNKFKEGDQVLIAVMHLHGIHATVLNVKDGQNICRINEHQFEGHVVSFADDQLEPLKNKKHLKKHPAERLDFSRYDQEADLDVEPVKPSDEDDAA